MMKSGNYNRIKEVLEEQGRTQTWLAKKLNITFRQVNSYCSNASQPSIPVLYYISVCCKRQFRNYLENRPRNY